jgi:hypothetical protein
MNKPWIYRVLNWKWLLLLMVLILACRLWPSGKRYPPGILIPSSPQMARIDTTQSWSYTSKEKVYNITPRAKYALQARVLSINKEYDDTRIGPVDIVVGWGAMSDQKVIDGMKIWQDNTRHWYCSPGSNGWPIELDEIALHAVNTHIIPANMDIEKKVKSIRRGDLIDIKGFLVDVSSDLGFNWRTSVDPSGFGEHSCKIIWVEHLDRR